MVLCVPHSTYQYIFSCTLHQYISAVQCIAPYIGAVPFTNIPVLYIFHKLVVCVHSTNILVLYMLQHQPRWCYTYDSTHVAGAVMTTAPAT